MKKGFALTLLTVAFALAQIPTASATAPVVSDPGDVIVGDLETGTSGATATCIFVFPDAFNLDTIVTDDATADADIKWSYAGTGKYVLNGIAPLVPGTTLGVDDPTSPATSARLDLNNLDSGSGTGFPEGDEDGNAITVTVRNADLSPDNTPNPAPSPGIDPLQTEAITLFASDCSTYTSRSITVFTGKATSDSISGGAAEIIRSDDYSGGALTGWLGGAFGGGGGSSDDTGATGVGLCMTVGLLGVNQVLWVSPSDYHQLVENTVYGARLSLTTSQATVDAIPLFFFVVDNVPLAGAGNQYGSEHWVLSADGHAQAIGTSVTFMDFLWAPNAVGTPQWQAGAHGDPAADSENDPRYQFRIIDSSAALVAELDEGTICIQSMDIYSINRDAIQVAAVEFNAPIDTSTHFSPANVETGGSGSVDNATDSITISVNPGGGNKISWGYFDSTQATLNARINPVQEQSGPAIYRGKSRIRAATSEADPVDSLQLTMQKANTENGIISFQVSQQEETIMGSASSPKLVAADYEVYFMNNNATASLTPDADRLRFGGFGINSDVLNVLQPAGTQQGGDAFVVESYEMERLVDFRPVQ
jgi:hypothetical protein